MPEYRNYTVSLFRSDPLDELRIPDGTEVEEHDLVTDGDVIIGGQSAIEFGIRGGNLVAGERVTFGGHIEAEGDCRLDMWCHVQDNVLVAEDAYLGERVEIDGELRVAGNLDIGDDVDIEEGFEANGWIVIRNPMPTIVFLFIYLSQLLRLGEEEAAEEFFSELLDDADAEQAPILIPRNSRVADDAWRVSTPGRIGDNCRLHGNIRAASLVVGRDNEIFGSLRAREGITVGAGTQITGNVTTREGTVRIGPDTDIRGDVAGEYVEVHHEATVEGAIRASEEMSMVSEPVIDDSVLEEEGTGEPAADDSVGTDTAAAESTAQEVDAESTDGDMTAETESATTEETSDGAEMELPPEPVTVAEPPADSEDETR